MGDRTHCTLQIVGALDASRIDELAETLQDAGADCSNIPQELRKGPAVFDFDEVNFATLDKDLVNTLKNLGLGFTWSWEPGGGYGSGIELYDPRSDTFAEYNYCDGDIMIPLSHVDVEGFVDTAKIWQRFDQSPVYATYSSRHELLKLVSDGIITQDWVDAALGAQSAED